jgi:hypothetical protein
MWYSNVLIELFQIISPCSSECLQFQLSLRFVYKFGSANLQLFQLKYGISLLNVYDCVDESNQANC